MKKLLILVGSIVLAGSIVAFGLLAHKNREIDLQKINSAVESFSQLDNGEMRSCTQSSSALKDLQYSYEDNVQLLFSQADGAFNYDLWQTSIQGNQTYQIGYKQLDGTFTAPTTRSIG